MKLRHLSIITLAGKFRTISYELLSQSLQIQNIRDLEDLIIEAFYLDIIDIALKTIETQIKQANSHKQNNIDLQANIDAEVKMNSFIRLYFTVNPRE